MKFTLCTYALAVLVLCGTPLHAQSRSDLYEDPLDQRKHATVDTEVIDGQIRIRVSATGAGVDALPGFRGRAGANMQTAYEITQLLLSDRLDVITTHSSGTPQGPWTIQPGTFGPLPERRLLWDGSIDYDAESEQSYWRGFSVRGSPLQAGSYTTEMWSRGELRLRMESVIGNDGQGQVTQFEAIPHGTDYIKQAGTLFRYVAASAAEDVPYKAPTKNEAWQKRDMEAKWVFFKKSHADGARLKDWVSFLQEAKDYAFLEWIALYEIDAANHYGIGEILAQADTPNYLRMIDWLRGDAPPERGYGWSTMDSVLLAEERQDVVYSWILKYELEDQYPRILESFAETKAQLVDVKKYDPPFARNHFSKPLTLPAKLAELPPNDEQADKGKVYLHQTLRAIDAVVIGSRTKEPRFLTKLSTLVAHPHPRVRQAVFLAYTHFPMTEVPLGLLPHVDNEKETDLVREAAFLAHSYRNDPEIYPDLLNIASQPEHPAWKAAVSRLGDLGDRFSLEAIQKLELDDPDQVKQVETAAAEIKARREKYVEKNKWHTLLKPMIHRAAWMKDRSNPIATDYFDVLVRETKQGADEATEMLDKYFKEPVFVSHAADDDTKRISQSVKLTLVMRELVADLKDTLK